MSYTALYRKFRPAAFDEVKGQDAIVKTLTNQLQAGRIGHAYLFCGTRGTGKTTVAKILARAVNCEHPNENGPCNECDTCRAILNGTSANVIEIDAASNNGVDNIREIREDVSYRPTSGKYKVYIIDEAHMLSTGAFNALLKTLEEPPEYVIFILATTEVNKIPVTILSRCQRYDFRRITVDTISARLEDLLGREQTEYEEKAVRYIARAADGSMRDALSLLDQCLAFYLGEKLTFDHVLKVLGTVDFDVFSRLLRAILASDTAGSIRVLEELLRDGREPGQLVLDFTWYLRNLMLLQNSDDLEDVLDVSAENLAVLREESKMVEPDALMRYIRIFSELSGQLRFAAQKRILMETALIRICNPEMDTDQTALAERIRRLEARLEETSARLEKLEAGIGSGAFSGKAVPESGSRKESGSGEKKEPAVEYAAPGDLKKAAGSWKKIAGSFQGLTGTWLKSVRPMYRSDSSRPVLYLQADGMAETYFRSNPQILDKVSEEVQNFVGRKLEIQMVSGNDRQESAALKEVPVEEILKEHVGMPVEEDNDEEE